MSTTVQVTMDELVKHLGGGAKRPQCAEWLRRGIAGGAALGERDLRRNLLRPSRVKPSRPGETPILRSHRGARLATSVGYTLSDDGLTARIGTSVFYILTHEGLAGDVQGDETVIRPKRKRVLRWLDEDGNPRFAKQVRIPIRRPVGRTFEEHADEWSEKVMRIILREFEEQKV